LPSVVVGQAFQQLYIALSNSRGDLTEQVGTIGMTEVGQR
jgi:hypothetical protein